MTKLPAGKLPAEALAAMLSRLPMTDPRVIVGPRPGEDAAIIDGGDRYLVITTDPITFASDRIGWYSVHVNANDIAVTGGTPRWFFAVLLLPARDAEVSMAERITAEIVGTCQALGISLCGGHTEITTAVDRPVVVGQMLGEVAKDRLVRKDAVEVGDRVLLTHGAAIEGTAILARERPEAVASHMDDAAVRRAQALLFDPGISVVRAAAIAISAGRIHAMHDPTEGGIATGLWELVHPSGLGLRVAGDSIPVLPETKAVCHAFEIDPLRLIASGALLAAVHPADASAVTLALEAAGIPAFDVGEIRPATEGVRLEVSGTLVPLEPAARDEIARVLAPARARAATACPSARRSPPSPRR